MFYFGAVRCQSDQMISEYDSDDDNDDDMLHATDKHVINCLAKVSMNEVSQIEDIFKDESSGAK